MTGENGICTLVDACFGDLVAAESWPPLMKYYLITPSKWWKRHTNQTSILIQIKVTKFRPT